jgi:uncharacterized protein YdeI (YjbR/CyaY-like superfamily)
VKFANAKALRGWFRQHHRTESEIVLRLVKNHVAHTGVTYPEALDEALCYGWIDGVRRALDADTYTQRFTPRRPTSVWSEVNIGHARRLIAEKRMTKAGLSAFNARGEVRSYAARRDGATLLPSHERRLRASSAAWRYFSRQAPYYRRGCMQWLSDAVRDETRERRLVLLIQCSEQGRRIPGFDRPAKGCIVFSEDHQR